MGRATKVHAGLMSGRGRSGVSRRCDGSGRGKRGRFPYAPCAVRQGLVRRKLQSHTREVAGSIPAAPNSFVQRNPLVERIGCKSGVSKPRHSCQFGPEGSFGADLGDTCAGEAPLENVLSESDACGGCRLVVGESCVGAEPEASLEDGAEPGSSRGALLANGAGCRVAAGACAASLGGGHARRPSGTSRDADGRRQRLERVHPPRRPSAYASVGGNIACAPDVPAPALARTRTRVCVGSHACASVDRRVASGPVGAASG
jgi:hypothetical protein